ncbi:MAG TPA: DUF87 domain-containing protein [bacterium]|nr:DUF87 domain-containing protein [bacterium]
MLEVGIFTGNQNLNKDMNQKIKLNNSIGFDLSKLIETKLLIQANSGGGKSWAIRRIIEQSFGKVQIIVIDPEGEFSNLREKYDFVLAGQGGDAPAEPRSASMLAERLLELRASAIIDLYELMPQERKRFVRLFIDSMVNAPKKLWHDCLVIIDEADIFAPEKSAGESEALGPVLSLASRGRKRGYCMILATQRIPKLHKDASAECNNKLIGRASQDIDRKRAANELGFYKKEEILSLRELDPGEFYAFGPAISREVVKIKVGDLKVKPPLRGQKGIEPPPPTEKVMQLLKQLADIPEEAKKEASTIAEYKQQVRDLTMTVRTAKAHKCSVAPSSEIVEKAVLVALQKQEIVSKKREEFIAKNGKLLISLIKEFTTKAAKIMDIPPVKVLIEPINTIVIPTPAVTKEPIRFQPPGELFSENNGNEDKPMGIGEKKILTAMAQYEEGMTRQHITVLTGYKRSSRDVYIQRLRSRGFVQVVGDKLSATQEGIEELGPDYKLLPTGAALQEHLIKTLPMGERKILSLLIDSYPSAVDRDVISESTGYQRSSRDVYIQRLTARNLVVTEGRGIIKAAEQLF